VALEGGSKLGRRGATAPDTAAGPRKRIHITGTPRSGTTLLLSLMLSCFDIDGGLPRDHRLWRRPPRDRRIVCTKFTDETDFAAAMLPLDPDLHVIFILRDPRDVVVSRTHVDTSRYVTNLHVWRANLAAAQKYFGHERMHVVRYEDLTADPDGVQATLLAEMPFLDPLRPFLCFTDCAEEDTGSWLTSMYMELRPVDSHGHGRWRKHLPRLKGQLARHGDLSDELLSLGFERDKKWLATLDNVEPDFCALTKGERPDFGARVTRGWRNALGAAAYLSRRYLGLEFSDMGENTWLADEPRAANENISPRVLPETSSRGRTETA